MRLFLGFPIPEIFWSGVQDELEVSRDVLAPVVLRWTAFEQAHITWRFLGELGDHDLSALIKTISVWHRSFVSFSLTCDKIDFFPETHDRYVAAYLSSDSFVVALRETLDRQLSEIGWCPDRYTWSPHMTLARCSARPDQWGALHFSSLGLDISVLHLYESQLRGDGRHNYEIVETFC